MIVEAVRVILTGGGTGGHLYPGLAILDALEARVFCETRFVGTRRGLEAKVVRQQGYDFKTIWISGLRRGRIFSNLLFPLKVVISLLQSVWIVLWFRPNVVIGTGGYVSWPVLAAACLLNKKTLIQEQNETPGLVTKALAAFVNSLHLSFESSKRYFWRQSNLHVSGNPTRDNLEGITRTRACRKLKLDPRKKTLFVFGGSQGARNLNNAVLGMIDSLMADPRVQILWATGPKWFSEIEKKTGIHSDRVRLLPFIGEMGAAYSSADLVVCRSGATTVAEIARLGLCAVFVPFPGAAEGHQESNARVMVDAEAAMMVRESEFPGGAFERTVLSLLKSPAKMKEIRGKAKTFAKPEAARTIAEDVLKLIGIHPGEEAVLEVRRGR